MKEYVIQRDGGYYIGDSRISLDSVVYAFQRGASPESIQRSFPLLTLEEVYGAIAFYLSHQQEVVSMSGGVSSGSAINVTPAQVVSISNRIIFSVRIGGEN